MQFLKVSVLDFIFLWLNFRHPPPLFSLFLHHHPPSSHILNGSSQPSSSYLSYLKDVSAPLSLACVDMHILNKMQKLDSCHCQLQPEQTNPVKQPTQVTFLMSIQDLKPTGYIKALHICNFFSRYPTTYLNLTALNLFFQLCVISKLHLVIFILLEVNMNAISKYQILTAFSLMP